MKEKKTSRSDQAGRREPNCSSLHSGFRMCAQWLSMAVGSPGAFLLAALSIVIWAAIGPIFHFSDTWQLVINTATTIITFLMVFLIQNTQNRDTKALHLKLDELLRGVGGARTSLVNLESLSDEELDRLQKEFERLRGRAARQNDGRRHHSSLEKTKTETA
jgi:low affinity Fe/Cu permease